MLFYFRWHIRQCTGAENATLSGSFSYSSGPVLILAGTLLMTQTHLFVCASWAEHGMLGTQGSNAAYAVPHSQSYQESHWQVFSVPGEGYGSERSWAASEYTGHQRHGEQY